MIFTPLVMLKLGRLITVPEIYYHYRKHPHSVIKLDTDDARADKLYTKKFLNDFIKKQGLNITGKDIIEYKKDYMFMGIKLLKIYKYRATKKFYLFGLLPFMTIKEYV